MSHPIADHIKNIEAKTFVENLRNGYCSSDCVYTSRYMVALSVVGSYELFTKLQDDKVFHIVRLSNGVDKIFSSAKSAGIFMEQKVDELFEFKVML